MFAVFAIVSTVSAMSISFFFMYLARCIMAGDNGKRFIVHADEKLTAFVELESAIHSCGELS